MEESERTIPPRGHYLHSRLDADTRHAQYMLVASRVHIDREKLGVPQRPSQFGVNLKVKVGICVINYLIHFEFVEPHQPVGLIQTVLSNKRRLFKCRQTVVVCVNRHIS